MTGQEDGSTKSGEEPDTKLEETTGASESQVSFTNDVCLQLNSADDVRQLIATRSVNSNGQTMGATMCRQMPESSIKPQILPQIGEAKPKKEKPKAKRKANVTNTVCQSKVSKDVKVTSGRVAKKRNKYNTMNKEKDSFYIGTLRNYSSSKTKQHRTRKDEDIDED